MCLEEVPTLALTLTLTLIEMCLEEVGYLWPRPLPLGIAFSYVCMVAGQVWLYCSVWLVPWFWYCAMQSNSLLG